MIEVCMAKLVLKTSENPVNIWKLAVLGLLSGGAFWGLFLCLSSKLPAPVASHIALVIITTVGLLIMVFAKFNRPLLIALASLASMWSFCAISNHLSSMEVLFWDLTLYTLAYSFYGWLSYIKKTSVAVILALIIVAAVHLISTSAMIQ